MIGMASQNNEEQPEELCKIIALAVVDEDFRRNMKTDLVKAIDDAAQAGKLPFSHNQLNQSSQEVLDSLTSGELEVMANIYEKSKNGGITPQKMF
jgi:hypothetical protein